MIKVNKINSICEGKYLKLKEVFFEIDGIKKRWEVCDSFDSVAILIYDKDLDSLILVKQFRLPVYLKNNDGYTYELCAGLCDKNLSDEVTAKEEILEECGYEVDEKDLELIATNWVNVGNQAARQKVYYVEVSQKDKVSPGGGIDDENIEVIGVKSDELENFIFNDVVLTPGARFALIWWLYYKKNKRM